MQVQPLLLAAMSILVAFAGCTSPAEPPEDEPGQTGQVAFYVKDAPADEFDHVYVTFDRVEVHRTGTGDEEDDNATTRPTTNATATQTETTTATTTNETIPPTNTTATSTPAPSSAGWITIVNETQTIDLKAFQGDARAFLGEANISVGRYTQIRIYVTESYGVRNGTGEEVNFTLPSNRLRVVGTWEVRADEVTLLTVDFELDQSIHMTGQGRYMFRPTMKLSVDHKDDLNAEDRADQVGQGAATQDRGRPTDRNRGRPTSTS